MGKLLDVRLIARLLTVAALGFVAWVVLASDVGRLLAELDAASGGVVAAVTLLLTAGWFTLAVAWARLVDRLARPSVLGTGGHVAVYATTQIQKYLPGNVFHFILRHIEARRRGESDEPLFWSGVGELVGQVVAAGLVAGLALSVSLADAHRLLAVGLVIVTGAVGVVGLRLLHRLLPWMVRLLVRLVGERGEQWHAAVDLHSVRLGTRDLLAVLPLYALYVVVWGVGAWALSYAADPLPVAVLPFVVGATALAWLAGYLLPGAPGGLGSREAVHTATLALVVAPETAVFIALAHRVCSIGSDLLFLAVGHLATRLRSVPPGGQP